MDENLSGGLEELWAGLLSRQPDIIEKSFRVLQPEEQQAVLAHLTRMLNEPGWHSEQRRSAKIALQNLKE